MGLRIAVLFSICLLPSLEGQASAMRNFLLVTIGRRRESAGSLVSLPVLEVHVCALAFCYLGRRGGSLACLLLPLGAEEGHL